MTFDPAPYEILPAILHWLTVVGGAVGFVLAVSFLMSIVMMGTKGPAALLRQIATGLTDFLRISCRRVWAIALLTIRESVRRKVLLVFVVFAVLFMFGGWFLADTGARASMQVKVYVSFVLTAISYLIMPVVLLLACWGIPQDIKARSLHTVVTKPIRRSEIVIGRMLGFGMVGTLVLAVMGVVGYFWIMRMVPADAQHRLVSRVPVYGKLNFLDREGQSEDAQGNPAKGLNVGDIWEFRGFIEGATRAKAIWNFDGVAAAQSGDSLVLESSFEAYRTHKGDIDRSLSVQYEFVNPQTDLHVKYKSFEVSEFGENITVVNRKLTYYDEKEQGLKKEADLFDDLVHNGQLRIEVQCLDPGQLIGMARPDLFIRLPDKPFASGYFKAIGGIWLMTMLIVVLSVTASCFLKFPIASVLTFVLILVGLFAHNFLDEMVSGQVRGGGPIESIIRIVEHMNQVSKMDPGLTTTLVKSADFVIVSGLWLVLQIIPDFQYFSMAPYVANGFDVHWSAAMLPSIAVTLAYVLPCMVLGYYSLKLRELEPK